MGVHGPAAFTSQCIYTSTIPQIFGRLIIPYPPHLKCPKTFGAIVP